MIDTKYYDSSTAETQELIPGLKSFGQGGEYADPTETPPPVITQALERLLHFSK